ncbi:hypothetical protein GF420_09390 [candidate division GN15 bacterium]|nr:hypothetical protein [candidate division GN15 bacterium]
MTFARVCIILVALFITSAAAQERDVGIDEEPRETRFGVLAGFTGWGQLGVFEDEYDTKRGLTGELFADFPVARQSTVGLALSLDKVILDAVLIDSSKVDPETFEVAVERQLVTFGLTAKYDLWSVGKRVLVRPGAMFGGAFLDELEARGVRFLPDTWFAVGALSVETSYALTPRFGLLLELSFFTSLTASNDLTDVSLEEIKQIRVGVLF